MDVTFIMALFTLIIIYVMCILFMNSGSDNEMDDDNGNEFEPATSIYFTTDYNGRRQKNEI